MCGRYQFSQISTDPALVRLRALVAKNYPDYEIPDGEILPSQRVPVLLPGERKAAVGLMYWGYPNPGGSGLLINARRETAGEKPLFRDSLRRRRCVVPITGYYEWSKDTKSRQKFFLSQSGKRLQYLAGLYDTFEGTARFVILTAQANPSVFDIHHRMPVILQQDQVLDWLNDASQARRILDQDLPDLEREAVS